MKDLLKRIRQTPATENRLQELLFTYCQKHCEKRYCYQDMWNFHTQIHTIFSIDFTFEDLRNSPSEGKRYKRASFSINSRTITHQPSLTR